MNNRIIVSAAGSGKTTFLVNQALKLKNESVLITTYTEANESEIKQKIYEIHGCIPSNITVMTWFSFLLKHGVRPYQDALETELSDKMIGFYLTNRKSGHRYGTVYWGESDFYKYFFNPQLKIYSDKVSKFILRINDETNNQVFKRIGLIFENIFIDEVQDLVGYDYDLLHHLFKLPISVLLVGDPRQVTYLTHPTSKYPKYRYGKLIEFIRDKINTKEIVCEVDTDTLKVSHRNNNKTCDYSSLLYPELPAIVACECCRDDLVAHQGLYMVKPSDLDVYLERFNPIQIRWNKNTPISKKTFAINMGKSKGLTFDRTLLYPTEKMINWIRDNSFKLKNETKAKFYVALTRARYSTAIVLNYKETEEFRGLQKYSPGGYNE